jgi:acetyl-CoA carboxylase biotin carboxylase subunit
MNIRRVLIANRGEIALRVVRACRALGIESVVAVSEADRESLPARAADRAVCIGPPRASESYLNIDAIVAAALGTGCDAVHPGYGFLAEEPRFAEACLEAGLRFIGPRPESIRQMGNKLEAREMVRRIGIPVVEGSSGVRSVDEARKIAEAVGFPLLFKAAAGGGGRGIKIVSEPSALQGAFETAAAEARAAFGDGTLYIERYVANARHIEVQVFGDRYGNAVQLGERDCSLQRRYQKVVEEAPAPKVPEKLRQEIRAAGLAIARAMQYENAGTVEFIVDRDENRFYFLEMNTRIQVEHPVTEAITGLDLVREQIRVAAGEPLAFSAPAVSFSGHAIECRLTAESPAHNFRPCPGAITEWRPPEGEGIRLDSHCYAGYVVPPYYDSLIGKLVCHGRDRAEALERMRGALERFVIRGIDTTIPFLLFLLRQPEYAEGEFNTRWVERCLARFPAPEGKA